MARPSRSFRGKAWMQLREVVFARYPFCEDCGGTPKEVHHVNGNANDHRLANLVGLCQDCHLARHGKAPRIDEGWARLLQKD